MEMKTIYINVTKSLKSRKKYWAALYGIFYAIFLLCEFANEAVAGFIMGSC